MRIKSKFRFVTLIKCQNSERVLQKLLIIYQKAYNSLTYYGCFKQTVCTTFTAPFSLTQGENTHKVLVILIYGCINR